MVSCSCVFKDHKFQWEIEDLKSEPNLCKNRNQNHWLSKLGNGSCMQKLCSSQNFLWLLQFVSLINLEGDVIHVSKLTSKLNYPH